jgi:hypothetical protein
MADAYETITYAALCARMGGAQIIPVYHMDAHENKPRIRLYVPDESPLEWIADLQARLKKWRTPHVQVVLVTEYPAEAVWPRWVTHQEVAL